MRSPQMFHKTMVRGLLVAALLAWAAAVGRDTVTLAMVPVGDPATWPIQPITVAWAPYLSWYRCGEVNAIRTASGNST